MKTFKTLLAASALASIAGAANATVWNIDMHTSVFFPAASGTLNMIGFTGTWNDVTGIGSWSGTTTIPGFNTTMHYTQTFFMPPAGKDEAPLGNFPLSPGVYAAEDWPPGYGWLDQLDSNTCTDNTGSACAGLATPLSGAFFNTVGTTDTDYKTPVGFTPVDGWTGTWTLQIYKYESPSDPNHFYPMYFNVALHSQASTAPVPAAAWLFGSGLIGLAAVRNKRK